MKGCDITVTHVLNASQNFILKDKLFYLTTGRRLDRNFTKLYNLFAKDKDKEAGWSKICY